MKNIILTPNPYRDKNFHTVRQAAEILKNAGLTTPFDEACLKEVCEAAVKWLDSFDLTGLE